MAIRERAITNLSACVEAASRHRAVGIEYQHVMPVTPTDGRDTSRRTGHSSRLMTVRRGAHSQLTPVVAAPCPNGPDCAYSQNRHEVAPMKENGDGQ
jgi:hypothetical protein